MGQFRNITPKSCNYLFIVQPEQFSYVTPSAYFCRVVSLCRRAKFLFSAQLVQTFWPGRFSFLSILVFILEPPEFQSLEMFLLFLVTRATGLFRDFGYYSNCNFHIWVFQSLSNCRNFSGSTINAVKTSPPPACLIPTLMYGSIFCCYHATPLSCRGNFSSSLVPRW